MVQCAAYTPAGTEVVPPVVAYDFFVSRLQMQAPGLASSFGSSGFVHCRFHVPMAGWSMCSLQCLQDDMSGGLVACIRFSGIATEALEQQQKRKLLRRMQQDGLEAKLLPSGEAQSLLLQYNDPGTLPPFRRNEVLVPIAGGFDLWSS